MCVAGSGVWIGWVWSDHSRRTLVPFSSWMDSLNAVRRLRARPFLLHALSLLLGLPFQPPIVIVLAPYDDTMTVTKHLTLCFLAASVCSLLSFCLLPMRDCAPSCHDHPSPLPPLHLAPAPHAIPPFLSLFPYTRLCVLCSYAHACILITV